MAEPGAITPTSSTKQSGSDYDPQEQQQQQPPPPPQLQPRSSQSSLRPPQSLRSMSSFSGRGQSPSRRAEMMEGLVLFDLTNKEGGTLTFSPHCIKSILDFKILGIVESSSSSQQQQDEGKTMSYERKRLSFVEVRTHLEERLGRAGVTVPTVELNDGSNLSDSWSIAEYLELHHPSGHLLFPSTSSKTYASFLHEYGKLLAPHLGALAIPTVATLLDQPSKEYFIHKKIGQARFERLSNLSSEAKRTHIDEAIKLLSPIEASLGTSSAIADDSTNGTRRSPWLAGTESPSHADGCLFGWYVYTRVAGASVTREIWYAHPKVREWIGAMLEWCGEEITKDFV